MTEIAVRFSTEDLVPRLESEFGLAHAAAVRVAERLSSLDGLIREAFWQWWTTGSLDDSIDVGGYTAARLVDKFGLVPTGAFSVLDGLAKDPTRTMTGLNRRFDRAPVGAGLQTARVSPTNLSIPSTEDETITDPVASTQLPSRPFVPRDGDMSGERLRALITLDGEDDQLEFKRTYDLAVQKDAIECVKTLVAMANTGGGYLVLGVDELGGPGPNLAVVGIQDSQIQSLDVTLMADKFEKYVEEPISVSIQVHRLPEHEFRPIALLYVAPAETLPLTFRIQGEYQVPLSGGQTKTSTAFRTGDIWIRRGGRCVLANARDWRRIRSDMRRAERNKWAEDLFAITPLIERMDRVSSLLERSLESGGRQEPANSVTSLGRSDYLLPAAQLAERAAPLFHDRDDGRLRRFLNGAQQVFYDVIRSLEGATAEDVATAKDNRLLPTLDSTVIIAVEALEYSDSTVAEAAADVLFSIYERAHRVQFPAIRGAVLDDVWVWGEVIERAYVLGAALVAHRRFIEARRLINHRIAWDDYWNHFLWSRHATTMMARANRLPGKGIVPLAVAGLAKEPWVVDAFGGDHDKMLDLLCQFDFLQCVNAVDLESRDDAGYPSFAAFYTQRTEPIVVALIIDPEVRRDAVPPIDDHRLAEIMETIGRLANREAFMMAGWDGWRDPRILQFLRTNVSRS